MAGVEGAFETDRRTVRSERPVELRHQFWWGPRHSEPVAQTAGLRRRCHAINKSIFEMTMRTTPQNAVEDDKSPSRITAYIVVVRQ